LAGLVENGFARPDGVASMTGGRLCSVSFSACPCKAR